MNVLLAGEESGGIQTLRALAQRSHRIVGVLALPETKGNGVASLASVAEKLGYPTWAAQLVRDPTFAETVRSRQVDILLNVYSLFFINSEVARAPRYGSFNLHPGPLPRYAGLNPISWALYPGERTHGVTLHKIEPGIDTGAIAYRALFDIQEHDTALSLSIRCVQKGLELIVQFLEAAAKGPDSIPLVPQDLSQREYFGREIPENGWLSWSRPAKQILNFVRACDYLPFRSAWGHPRTRLRDQEVAIAKACSTRRACHEPPGTVSMSSDSEIEVACADEWVRIDRVLVEGTFVAPAQILKTGDYLQDARNRV